MQDPWPNRSDPGPTELPTPGLNPLLNPLLEQNLGRWAQVYFTNPPEIRERAVLELLRELDSQSAGSVPPQSPDPQAAHLARTEVEIPCSACDAPNRPQQRFCGFCGSPLRAGEEGGPRRAKFAVQSEGQAPEPETLSVLGLSSPAPKNDLGFLREKAFASQYYEPDTHSHRRRYLIAAAAVILVAAAVIEWPPLRGRVQSALRRSGAVPAAQESAPAPQPAATPSIETSLPPSSADIPSQPLSAQVQPPQRGAGTISESSRKIAGPGGDVAEQHLEPTGSASAASVVTLAARSTASRGADGTQELFLAKRYLAGEGTQPDKSTAARWLWKAVSKQNGQAAVLLAGLYVRGDGVSKSCDQARILLEVAAARRVPAAAQELRNLPANGCP